MLNRFIYLFATKAIVMFDLKKIIIFYFYSFLFVDLINGFLLKELSIDFPISFGQLIRGILTFLLLIDVFKNKKITDSNKFSLLFIILTPFIIIIYFLNDLSFKAITLNILEISKVVFFLLLLDNIVKNSSFYMKKINSIFMINLYIFSLSIILSFIFGIGIDAYKNYYVSNKSYFYASNATAVIGFTMCIYFTYMAKIKYKHIFNLLLVITAFIISGSKIILLYPLFMIYFFYNEFLNEFKYKILTILVVPLLLSLFFTNFFDPNIFIKNILVERYQERTLHSINMFKKHEQIDIEPLKWYSYVSGIRAYRADRGIKEIFSNPTNLFFGFGTAMKSKVIGMKYGGQSGSEMDFIDIFLNFGIIGFLLVVIPIMKLIFPLILNFNTNFLATSIYFIFLYSFFAGHVITSPMAGSIFALLLGSSKQNFVKNRL